MKTIEEIRLAADDLRDRIKILVDEFVVENGECSVELRTSVTKITLAARKFHYVHDVEVTVTI